MNIGRLIAEHDPTALTVDRTGTAPIDRQELAWSIALDSHGAVKAVVRVAMGGCASVHVHLVPFLHVPVSVSADQVALVHSHPSGSLTVSAEDRLLTRAVLKATAACGITLVDHYIVTPDGSALSLVKAGVMAPLPAPRIPQAAD